MSETLAASARRTEGNGSLAGADWLLMTRMQGSFLGDRLPDRVVLHHVLGAVRGFHHDSVLHPNASTFGVGVVARSVVLQDQRAAVLEQDRRRHAADICDQSLALALRTDCPIFVDDSVLKNSKMTSTTSDRVNNEELKKWLEQLNDEDFGRYKM